LHLTPKTIEIRKKERERRNDFSVTIYSLQCRTTKYQNSYFLQKGEENHHAGTLDDEG
jgi:hypothetical protein